MYQPAYCGYITEEEMIQTEEIKKITTEFTPFEILKALFNASVQKNISVALWKLPTENTITLIADPQTEDISSEDNIENCSPGFLTAPFDKSVSTHGHFIKASLLYTTTNGLSFSPSLDSAQRAILEEVITEAAQKKAFVNPDNTPEKLISTDYISLVKKAITHLNSTSFKKVVLSRSAEIKTAQNTEPTEIFTKLTETYPNSFVSLHFHPEHGVWLGATPETLLHIDEHKIFRTIALAGTQLLPENDLVTNVVWTQKEIEEQALVGRYIVNCFKTIRLREFEEDGPKTVQAGPLVHLKTDYWVNMTEVNIPDLGSIMLRLLHPTSAVCGTSKEDALRFIQENEKLDRQLFSGYLGPVNINNDTHLFVNLRCVRLYRSSALAFAGAGITKNSDPEKEKKETELKMNTIVQFLK